MGMPGTQDLLHRRRQRQRRRRRSGGAGGTAGGCCYRQRLTGGLAIPARINCSPFAHRITPAGLAHLHDRRPLHGKLHRGAIDRNSIGRRGLGDALYMCGRYEEAVRAGQRAVGIDAGSLEAQVGLGRALYMCGRYEEAVAAYKAALALDAGNREAHSGLGLALGRWEKDAGR